MGAAWISYVVVPCVAYWMIPRPSTVAYAGIGVVLWKIFRRKKILGPEAPVWNMDGKKGANVGLGYETALTLASWGADVTIACRNMKKANDAVEKILKRLSGGYIGSINAMKLDLTDLKSIEDFSSKYAKKNKNAPLDVLINNAGVMAVRDLETTKDGFEMQMGTNHFGHFALTQELLPLLEKSSDGRIVTVSSLLHTHANVRDLMANFNDVSRPERYKPWTAYAYSKGIKITATALEPGVVRTELGRHLFSKLDITSIAYGVLSCLVLPFSQSANQGAQTQIRLASDPRLRGDKTAGQYFRKSALKPDTFEKIGPEYEAVASELWKASEKLTKRKFL